MTASNNVEVGLASSATAEQYDAACEAKLMASAQAANSITVKAYGEKPTIAIPISVLIFG